MKNLPTYEEFKPINEETLNEISFFGIDAKSFSTYMEKLKSKFKRFMANIKTEKEETREAFAKLIDSIKTGKKLSESEREEIGNQMKDVLKLSGFVAASILPGGFIYLLLANMPALKKYMVPSSFLKSDNDLYLATQVPGDGIAY